MENTDLPFALGAHSTLVCLVKAASSETAEGFRTIVPARAGVRNWLQPDVYADGVVLSKPGSSAIMRTADCAAVFLYEETTRVGIFFHAGRPAMTPDPLLSDRTIVDHAYQQLTHGLRSPVVNAAVIGSICGLCFTHPHTGPGTAVYRFKQRFGTIAFSNFSTGALDLTGIICHQLEERGVTEVFVDNTCTEETPELASYHRDGTKRRNPVVVVLH